MHNKISVCLQQVLDWLSDTGRTAPLPADLQRGLDQANGLFQAAAAIRSHLARIPHAPACGTHRGADCDCKLSASTAPAPEAP